MRSYVPPKPVPVADVLLLPNRAPLPPVLGVVLAPKPVVEEPKPGKWGDHVNKRSRDGSYRVGADRREVIRQVTRKKAHSPPEGLLCPNVPKPVFGC